MSRIVITKVQAIILVVAITAVACAFFYLATLQTQALENAEPIMEEPEEILIGTAVSLTGKESVSGTCARNAYELAIKEVNERGGIEMRELGRKLPVRLIIYDDESDPEKSASLIERLIIEDKVDVLLSSMTTPIVEPQTEVAEKHHLSARFGKSFFS
jgi:ABC-type branched-subunit amino acid transport system substrate-binding protein